MTYECEKCGDQFDWDGELGRCDQPLTDVDRVGARYKWRRGEDGNPVGNALLADGREVELCSGRLLRVELCA